jgi:hypothetical protein
MDATWGREGSGNEWDAAVRLAGDLAAGCSLPVMPSPVLLEPGEVLHADLTAYGWRFHGVDVIYEEPRALGIGGPLFFAVTAAAAASARRRARAEAERLASPQWRTLGHLRILATDSRLLVLYQGAWASVWYAGIRQMHPAVHEQRLQLIFEDDPPYALAGPWVPYLTVVLTATLADQLGVDAVANALAVRS